MALIPLKDCYDDDIVAIVDVGGQEFKTYTKTLKKIVYFRDQKVDEDREITFFIDRNPKYFEIVLDVARNSDEIISNFKTLYAYIPENEAKFYMNINGKKNEISKPLLDHDNVFAMEINKGENPNGTEHIIRFAGNTLSSAPGANYFKPEIECIVPQVLAKTIAYIELTIGNVNLGNYHIALIGTWSLHSDNIFRKLKATFWDTDKWIPNYGNMTVRFFNDKGNVIPIDGFVIYGTAIYHSNRKCDIIYKSNFSNYSPDVDLVEPGSFLQKVDIISNQPLNGIITFTPETIYKTTRFDAIVNSKIILSTVIYTLPFNIRAPSIKIFVNIVRGPETFKVVTTTVCKMQRDSTNGLITLKPI